VKDPGAATPSDRAQERLRCPLCSKRFTLYKKYRAHVQRHRQKASGRYECPICSKRLVQKSSLNTHLRIHTGERPFSCEDCMAQFSDIRSFSQSGNLYRHTRVVHA
ncbi:unnamed protein product, partial [Ixodes hexagonus]